MNERENILRAIRFERPDAIPMQFHINAACWHHYPSEALRDLMSAHPYLFPGGPPAPGNRVSYALNQRADAPYTDPWGCVWETLDNGITGSVHNHPLADPQAIETLNVPDPDTTDGTFPVDWAAGRAAANVARREGRLVVRGLPHGHTFLRLQDLCGYEAFLFGLMDAVPSMLRLVERVADFNGEVVRRCLACRPDVMGYPEDLGMQVGPMISPSLFREYIQPVYRRLMAPARAAGCVVAMHSDGDIRLLADDLVEGGVDVLNLQDLVNGIDWIAARFAGRVCIELDIDRQRITAQGTPAQIDALIREEVEKLGSAAGGLMMIYGLYPGVPLANVGALMDAMERYAGHHS